MRGQNHAHRRETYIHTDEQTDGQGETNIPLNFVSGRY